MPKKMTAVTRAEAKIKKLKGDLKKAEAALQLIEKKSAVKTKVAKPKKTAKTAKRGPSRPSKAAKK